MPYISSEEVSKKRAAVKAAFPDFKFSITKDNYSSINVVILEAPFNMLLSDKSTYESVNPYRTEEWYKEIPKAGKVIRDIHAIINEGNRTISEDGDYGRIPAFYTNIRVGDWDKPFKVVAPNKAAVKPKNNGVVIPKVEVADGDIKVVEYSKKSFALVGAKTKELKDELAALGGSFNFRLTCGAGWIFSNKKRVEVDQFLTKLGLVQIDAIFAEAKERFEGTLEKIAD